MIVGHEPNALAVGAGGVVWAFLFSSIFYFLSPSLWETAKYRLKYCLKGPLNPKQPTKQPKLQNMAQKKFKYAFLWLSLPDSVRVTG